MGKPSSTVAADAAPPGTPNRTAGMGSPVAVVAPRPSRSAKAEYGSIVNVNGSNIAVPARPPMPGTMPSTRPIMQPSPRYMSRSGSSSMNRAFEAAAPMKAISPVTVSISADLQDVPLRPHQNTYGHAN